MTFLNLDRIHDQEIWGSCYVCGAEISVGTKDAGYECSPVDYQEFMGSSACKKCQQYGAPCIRPTDWTVEKTREVLAKVRASVQPPVVATPTHQTVDPDREKRQREIIDALARRLH